ncbi:MAG: Carboxypeptidase 1 [Chlamydiia bacterium]|nr:Carboxypeptidase 1 [Chlamydiia bacterium]
MTTSNKDLLKIIEECQKAAQFTSLEYLASWDQETYMPKDGIEPKAAIMSFIAQEKHKIMTGTKLKNSIDALTSTPPASFDEQIIVKRIHEDIEKQKKLGKSFVKKFSKETAHACEAWKKAHKNSNFKQFLPSLKKVINLCKKKAQLIGYSDHPYDALLDEFEPGMTTKQLDEIFGEVKPRLISLVKKITSKESKSSDFDLKGPFPIHKQKELSHDVIKRIGVNPDQYNLSTTHHPFCIPLHPHDIRITSHYHEQDVLKGFTAAVHEAGHGLYENNMPADFYGTPLAEASSIGIHESQSRIYETCLGNSKPFWKFYYPKFQQLFPEALGSISMEDFVSKVREVKPSLIRIFADEVTYCLHVILRYEIEKGLIENSINPKDIPNIWKAKIQESLGILPTSDATGCLQDIHWSIGCFGYFPTYGLGSMYAGSLFTKFIKQNIDWESKIASGDFSILSSYLKENIHVHGRKYLPFELIERATEKPFSPEDYICYLEHRYL